MGGWVAYRSEITMSQLAEGESAAFCIRQIRELNKSQMSISLGQHFHGNHRPYYSSHNDSAAAALVVGSTSRTFSLWVSF